MPVLKKKWNDNDPANPRDMLGQPIVEGDFVSWPISIGRSTGMSVGEIVTINFKHKNPDRHEPPYKEWINGEQQGADHYTLSLRPVISTGYYSEHTEYVPEGYTDEAGRTRFFRPTGKPQRAVILYLVAKVLKLDPETVHAAMRELST